MALRRRSGIGLLWRARLKYRRRAQDAEHEAFTATLALQDLADATESVLVLGHRLWEDNQHDPAYDEFSDALTAASKALTAARVVAGGDAASEGKR